MPDSALLSIVGYFGAVFAPHAYSLGLVGSSKHPKAWNNAQGRGSRAQVEKLLSGDELGRFQRARQAHDNGNEGFQYFAAAVLAAKFAGLDVGQLAWGIVGLRVLYTVLYVNTTRLGPSWARTAVWLALTGAKFWIIVRAAYAVTDGKVVV